MIGCRGIVVGLVLDRLLARFDLGGVARDRPDDASPEGALDQRGVDLVWQRAASEFGERPGKGGFGRDLRASLPAEDATQGLVDGEALDQDAGGGNAQDRFGHESSREGATVLGRPALYNNGAPPEPQSQSISMSHLKTITKAINTIALPDRIHQSSCKRLIELREAARTDANARQKYISLSESVAGVRKFTDVGLIDIGQNISSELAKNLEPVERFDRMIASAETRRNNTLHEIERHRAGLGAALRSATTEVEDAEFTELETGEQVVGAAE
jgi:hypothetical protein